MTLVHIVATKLLTNIKAALTGWNFFIPKIPWKFTLKICYQFFRQLFWV